MGKVKEKPPVWITAKDEFDESAYRALQDNAAGNEPLKNLLKAVDVLQGKVNRSKFSKIDTRDLVDRELTSIAGQYHRDLQNDILHKKLAIIDSKSMYEKERGTLATEDLTRLTRLQMRYNAMSKDELTKQANDFIAGSEELNPDEFDLLSSKLKQSNDKNFDIVRLTGKQRNTDRPWMNFPKNQAIQKQIDAIENYGGPGHSEFRTVDDQGRAVGYSISGLVDLNRRDKRSFDD